MSAVDGSPILTEPERRMFIEKTNSELYRMDLGDLANLMKSMPGTIGGFKEKLATTNRYLNALRAYKNGDHSQIWHYKFLQEFERKYGVDDAIRRMEDVYKNNERSLMMTEIKYNMLKEKIAAAGKALKSTASSVGKQTNAKAAILAVVFLGSISLLSLFQFQRTTGYFTAPSYAPNLFVSLPLTAVLLALLGFFYLREQKLKRK
jgi:hypothetical protein